MGGVALAELAAGVSNAGGIGTIGLAGFTPEGIQNEIAAARKLTNKPLLVNLLVPFLRPGIIEVVLKEPIQGVTFFWGEPAEYVPIAKKSGLKVIWQCGSVKERSLRAMRAPTPHGARLRGGRSRPRHRHPAWREVIADRLASMVR